MGVWDKIKGFGKRVWSGIKTGFNKAKEFGGKVIDKVSQVASYFPGVVGTVGKTVQSGIRAARELAGRVPSKQVQDKVNKVIDTAERKTQQVDSRARDIYDRGRSQVQGVVDKVKPWAQFADSVVNKPPANM